MKIKCTLDTLGDAIKKLNTYKQQLKRRNTIFLYELSNVGIDSAGKYFSSAIYDGYNDVQVSFQPVFVNKQKTVISAVGHSITFIEFGSGVHYSSPTHPLAQQFGYARGGFGHHLGLHDSWRYTGVAGSRGQVITEGIHAGQILTHGNPANMCMYNAGKNMRKSIVKIGRVCFRQ